MTKNQPEQLPTISASEIWASNPILKWLADHIGFQNWKTRIALLAVICIPFLFSAFVTKQEHRFMLGDVTAIKDFAVITQTQYQELEEKFGFKKLEKKHLNIKSGSEEQYIYIDIANLKSLLVGSSFNGSESEIMEYLQSNIYSKEIIGMSYLGDPMVWPFYFLVPIAIILLGLAIKRTENFFSSLRSSIIIEADTKNTYSRLIAETKKSFAAEDFWKWARYIGLAIGFSFITWNTITCTFSDITHPYSSDTVFLKGETEITHLVNKTDLPKWDTNIQEAPMSWFAARIWVIFGYLLIPIILAKLINLVGVLYSFSCKINAEKNILKIAPLSPDKAGGFSSLSNVAISLVYIVIPYLLMLIASFMKESTPASFHNYLLVILFIPIFFAVFILPLMSFHVAMRRAKENYLRKISHKFNQLNDHLLNGIYTNSIKKEELEQTEQQIQVLKRMYDQADKMTEWPVDMGTIYRFIGSFVGPTALAALFEYAVKIINSTT
ncbi:MAG TPA: hypothetical protein ENK67_02405 [Flavobacteriia bacterium]|nr:hypothetical protein [Flavobacteriia bacterium]